MTKQVSNQNTSKKQVTEDLLPTNPQNIEQEIGFFGIHGGQFVPDIVKVRLDELAKAYLKYKYEPMFLQELALLYTHFSGRPTPIYYCENLSKELGGADIYLKREDLNHLGAHKLNNVLGQMLLAKRMGKTKIIAETGAGQHGVATASAAALFGFECTIYMGEEDIRRQELNVLRMQMMGAKVIAATSGQKTLKEAVDEAFIAYINLPDSFYVLGSAVGPYPYPDMVRDFQAIISKESRSQFYELTATLPDMVIACVGGGSNAIGSFAHFIEDEDVALVGVEPGGRGNDLGEHAASLSMGTVGILHGFKSYMLQDVNGEAAPVYSISAGLDYPSVGPEHSYLKDIGRAQYYAVSDMEAIEAFFALSRHQGIIPALESSHALAYAIKIAPQMRGKSLLVTLSGRGDKDVDQISKMLKDGKINMFKDDIRI